MKTFILFFLLITTSLYSQSKKETEEKFRTFLETEISKNIIDNGEIIITKDYYKVYKDALNYENKESWFCVFDDLNGSYYHLVYDTKTGVIYLNEYQVALNTVQKENYKTFASLKKIDFNLIVSKFKDITHSRPSDIRIVFNEVNYKNIGSTMKPRFIKLSSSGYQLYLDMYTYERL
ncbi:MAG: hypothetical protein QM564_05560 [Bergeyella sp.]